MTKIPNDLAEDLLLFLQKHALSPQTHASEAEALMVRLESFMEQAPAPPDDLSVERYASWPLYSGKPIPQVLANIEDLQSFQVTDTVWGPKIRRYSFLIGASWSALTPDERHECGTLRDELKRVGFDPGWEQAT
jgi:hypothetical protein